MCHACDEEHEAKLTCYVVPGRMRPVQRKLSASAVMMGAIL